MENKLALKKSESMEMSEFFYNEFQTLRAKTGIRQWEQLNEAPNATKAIHDVIEFMCQECGKPPFDIVQPEVKQRVISRAIVEDQDFIGLNAKFVRKALNTWWVANKDRVFEERNKQAESVYEKIKLTPEENEKVNVLLESYKRRLLSEAGFKPVPKIRPEVLEEQGAERMKPTHYPLTSESEARKHELHLEWARKNYDPRTMDKLPSWKPEDEWVESLTEQARKEIESRILKPL